MDLALAVSKPRPNPPVSRRRSGGFQRVDSIRTKALEMVDNPKGRTLTSLYNKPTS